MFDPFDPPEPMTLTPDIVTERIKAIQAAADEGDPEKAHSLEDRLQRDFIAWIDTIMCGPLATESNIGKMAKQILSTSDIQFERWCA